MTYKTESIYISHVLNYGMNKQDLIVELVRRNFKGESTPVENIFLKKYFLYKGKQAIAEMLD